MLLLYTQTMPSTGRGPPKNRTKDKRKQRLIAWNDDMTMDYDKLQAMSVPPERPAGQSSAVVPFPGDRGFHAYHCWCDACLASLVTRWKEFHPTKTVLPDKRPAKPVVPFV